MAVRAYDDMETNKFVEDTIGAKSTIRTSLYDENGNLIGGSTNPIITISSDAQLEDSPVTYAVIVGDTPTQLDVSAVADRKSIVIRNNDLNETLYIGGPTVGASTGFPLLPLEAQDFDLIYTSGIYAIAESGKTAEIRIMELK